MSAPDLVALAAVLIEHGLAAPGEALTFTPLGGGISNDVLAVTAGGRELVVKQALPKLRVAAEWRSAVTRIHREAACQRWLAEVLADGEVPIVVAEDEARHVLVMMRAPHECRNWKDEMMAGRVDATAAARAGDLLGRVHAAGRHDAAIRAALSGKTVFDELRLDPYLRAAARTNPAVAEELARLCEELDASEETVVHGDFSPKNLLLSGDHVVLLDHEVAHVGDPRFDLGFLFTHLLLKAVHVTVAAEALWAQIPACWAAYGARYEVEEAAWLPVWGAILLARLDGKSPAGYLSRAEEDRLRPVAYALLRGEADGLAAALDLAKGR
jgi:5-methylthioribose kinase